MKRTISLICIGTLALSVTAWAKDDKGSWRSKGKSKASSAAVQKVSVNRSAHVMRNASRVSSPRNLSSARFSRQNTQLKSHFKNNNAIVRHNTVQTARVNTLRSQNFNSAKVQARKSVTIKRARNLEVGGSGNLTINRHRNFNRNLTINGNRNFAVNRQRNLTITNNWKGDRFSGQHYSAFRNYHRQWHNQSWWRHNHSRITFYFGAPYYWDSGYWYPAWGYYPDYVYQYDGPIYGYNDLAPDQVVINVQAQLQRDGYYAGPIDGVLGPMTRQAIAAFQADHGLAITSSVDQPTLETLGLS